MFLYVLFSCFILKIDVEKLFYFFIYNLLDFVMCWLLYVFFLFLGWLLLFEEKYIVLYLWVNGFYFFIICYNFLYLCVKENGDGIVLVGEIFEGGNMEMDKWLLKVVFNNDL